MKKTFQRLGVKVDLNDFFQKANNGKIQLKIVDRDISEALELECSRDIWQKNGLKNKKEFHWFLNEETELVKRISADEIIKAVHAAGAKAFWAHPMKSLNGDFKTIEICAKRLKFAGLDGLEVFYHDNSKEQSEFLFGVAKKLGLRISSGSDYHTDVDDKMRFVKNLGLFEKESDYNDIL